MSGSYQSNQLVKQIDLSKANTQVDLGTYTLNLTAFYMDSGVYPRFRFIIDKPFELDGQEIVVTVASDNWSITFGFITHGSLVYEYVSGRQYEDAEYVYVDSIEFTNTDDYTATIDSNWGEPVYKS